MGDDIFIEQMEITQMLELTKEEMAALKWLLIEKSQEMDDDGRDGSFERSPLFTIYEKVLKATK
jgi:hypothetical protein